MKLNRTISWFSCGCPSTIASYLALKKYPETILVYCDTGSEHPDNKRYLRDVEQWLNTKIQILRSKKYKDHFDVIKKRRFINSPNGARCTTELKKNLRIDFQQQDDIQNFGYTYDEKKRAERFEKISPEVDCRFPLIENKITKKDAIGLVKEAGIELPIMYKLGFQNNNCIGCVKGGMGYWNHIRKYFPEHFNKMAEIEEDIGASCVKNTPLIKLKPNTGIKPENISCGFDCDSQIDLFREKVII